MKFFPLIGFAASAALIGVVPATPQADDPFIWLEQAHSERAMNWVKAENAKTDKVLERDPRFKPLFHEAQVIVDAKDRIPEPSIIAEQVFNFWQDAEHAHGIWRETSQADFQSATPGWHTVIDLDALSKSEKANWFWKGAICHEPEEQRCIVNLSDGGEDAVTLREFDLGKAAFVAGGFSLPSGKQDVAWLDADTLLLSREWKPGEMTRSGYAFVVKRIKRGEPLDAAVEVYRGTPNDVGVSPISFSDGTGHSAAFIQRAVSIFEFEQYLLGPEGPVKLAMPMKAEMLALIDGRLIVSLHEDWKRAGQPTLPQGSLVSLELAAMEADPQHLQPALVYAPGPREAFVEAGATRGHLVVHTLDNVNGRAYAYTPEPHNRWSRRALDLPNNISVNVIDTNLHGEQAFVQVTGFLTPPKLMLADLAKGSLQTVKTLPAKFDASRDVVRQFEATSKDGTKIPYFIVHPMAMKMDGSTPAILNAYGGFLDARTPTYSAELGKLWLERGGVFVLANIRGGGEFGPAWHEAGLKTHRQRIYDDFAAVGEDLIAKGFTSSAHLGIMGGSNGGLLMGVEFIQHPQLWRAVDIQVPLLDMLRYEQIAAGSSWVAEYGSVSVPEERAFLASISPYNNLKAGVQYPEALIWSTTKDDRVGPQHARKFAAKLAAMGVPYLYFEVIEGGHGAGATLDEKAKMHAREYTYFSRKLGL
ncbi:MAG TPA: prolyl oligopeptidase family serine peptidase [Steroidobacteraceae bacterium]|nr:prolyl oligopeptidase family serine peptidase [Steroidobacteraceae bacterium]